MTCFQFSTSTGARLAALAAMAAIGLGASQASAQDRVIRFELGTGPRYAPIYEGASDYGVSPGLTGGLTALSLGSIRIDRGDAGGFSFGPSFRYVGAREAADAPVLAGIPDRDWALEVGGKASYEWDNAMVFGAVRKGFNGHRGIVGDLGADLIMRPSARTTVRFGPRLSVADQSYMDSYFSVPVTATALPPYAASAGLKSTGLELSVRQQLSDRWAILGTLGHDRLRGDAAASPIVQAGSRDQSSISLMMIREFNLRF